MADRYGLEIRALVEADAAGLAELLEGAGVQATRTALAERIAKVRRQPGVALAAVEWGPPSGVAVAAWSWGLAQAAPAAELTLLLVGAEDRRRGLGRLLLKSVAQAARQAGCAELRVAVGAEPGLEAFCLAAGFSPAAAGFVRPLRKRA